jgi:hypothetical protein
MAATRPSFGRAVSMWTATAVGVVASLAFPYMWLMYGRVGLAWTFVTGAVMIGVDLLVSSAPWENFASLRRNGACTLRRAARRGTPAHLLEGMSRIQRAPRGIGRPQRALRTARGDVRRTGPDR